MFVTDDMIREMEERFGKPETRDFRIECSISELQRIASSQKSGRNHDVTLYVRKGEQWVVIAKHPYPDGLFRSPSGGIHPGEDFMTGINREVAEELGCRVRLERFLLRTNVDFHLPPKGLMPLVDPPPGAVRLLYGPPLTDMIRKRRGRISVYRVPDENVEPEELLTPLPAKNEKTRRGPAPSFPESIYWRSFVFLATYVDGDFNYTDHDEIREVKVVDWDQFAEYGKIMRKSGSGGLRYRADLHEVVAQILGKP